MAGRVLFISPPLLLRGGHVTPNARLGQSKKCYIRLRVFSNIEHLRQSSNGHRQKEDGKNSQTFIVKALDGVKPVLKFASTNFLPLALISGVVIGLINPVPGCLAQKYSLSTWSTSGIFLISGLMLKSGEMNAAVEAWQAGIFGLASILFFTPFVSTLVLRLKFMPQEFLTGLATFCCMPTTLSSGVTLTQLVGANSALSLAMTLTSNLLGILTTPFMLSKFVAQGVGVSIPVKQLLKSLTMTLLVPLLIGKGIRNSFHGVAEYLDQRRQLFSMISSIFLSLVPWMQVSGSRTLILTISPTKFLVAIVIGLFLHILFLTWNKVMMQSISIIFGDEESVFVKKDNVRAIMIVASQKTLPVMVSIVEQLGGVLGETGLLVIPCVFAHISQKTLPVMVSIVEQLGGVLGETDHCGFFLSKYMASKGQNYHTH